MITGGFLEKKKRTLPVLWSPADCTTSPNEPWESPVWRGTMRKVVFQPTNWQSLCVVGRSDLGKTNLKNLRWNYTTAYPLVIRHGKSNDERMDTRPFLSKEPAGHQPAIRIKSSSSKHLQIYPMELPTHHFPHQKPPTQIWGVKLASWSIGSMMYIPFLWLGHLH